MHANLQSVVSNSPMQKRVIGFTLLESLIAISIAAILLAVAAPSFTGAIANHRVKAAATDIHMALLKARSEATSHNTNVIITPVGGVWGSGWQTMRGVVVIENHGVFKGVAISANTATAVTYRSSGRVLGAVDFTVTSESLGTVKRCVSVDLSGRPYVKEGTC